MLIPTILLAAGSASAATMTVTVAANNKFTFTPNTMTAQPGDMIAFNFAAQNHSIASSGANTPCQPERNAIFSDFQPVAGPAGGAGAGAGGNARKGGKNNRRQANTPTFMVPVTDNQPMYIYCSQAQHCQAGMVMVINPPNAQAVQQYAAKAAKAKNNVSPQGGVSGGQMINNAAGTTPASVLGANAGDAAKAATKGKGKAAGGTAAGLLAALGKGKNNRREAMVEIWERHEEVTQVQGEKRHEATEKRHEATEKRHEATEKRHEATEKRHEEVRHIAGEKRHETEEKRHEATEKRGKGLDIAAGIVGAIPGTGVASGVLRSCGRSWCSS
ncbi:hypothetical protein HBI13_160190 [Parastagonospora nodorum]|nr:hypothetical protein HBI13_160190 [Parastagonospora nodorum]KAH6107425.1 hypothetical protein HBI65_026500 [Parastagonospora nodorum]